MEFSAKKRKLKPDQLSVMLFPEEKTALVVAENINFEGSSSILDPESNKLEKIEFSGGLQKLEIEFKIIKEEPKIEVSRVLFNIDEKSFVLSTFGDLPLYKSHNLEQKLREGVFHHESAISQ